MDDYPTIPEMTTKQFIEWADQTVYVDVRDMRSGVQSLSSTVQMCRLIAQQAYEDGYDRASWEASGRPNA